MMKTTQTGMISRRMAASHVAREFTCAIAAPSSIMTIITTTMTTTTRLGASGA